jgi:hypothetical protein
MVADTLKETVPRADGVVSVIKQPDLKNILLASSFKTSETGGKFVTDNNDIYDSKPFAQC